LIGEIKGIMERFILLKPKSIKIYDIILKNKINEFVYSKSIFPSKLYLKAKKNTLEG